MPFHRKIELSLWVVGLLLLAFYGAVRTLSEYARAEGVEAFQRTNRQPAHSSEKVASASGVASDRPDQSLWSRQRILAFERSLVTAATPEGLLRIPSVALEVPIYAGTSELNLNRGAARVPGTATLSGAGNVAIAGHRDGFFRKLKDVRLGQTIYIDAAGRSRRYRVVDLSIVEPSDVEVLAPTDAPSITLVTCYPFYFVGTAPRRYIVRAELDEQMQAATARAAR